MNAILVPELTLRAVAFAAGSQVASNRPTTPEKVIETTGFESRRVVAPGEDLFSLASNAVRQLPKEDLCDLGGVVAASFSAQDRFPSLAVRIASTFGIDASAPALDLQMACSAYPYALYVAGRIASDTGKKVLVIDGDVQSPLAGGSDPATAPLFSDAVSATIVECDSVSGRQSLFAFLSRYSRALSCPPSGPIEMDGFGVFSFVASEVAPFLGEFLAAAGGAGAIDCFVPHQANMYIVRQLTRMLSLENKIVTAGAEYANPGSCSIPLAISRCARSGRYMLSGFGAGLSAAAAIVRVSGGRRDGAIVEGTAPAQ